MAKFVARSYFDTVGNSADDGLKCEDESLTVQASKEECDINVIVAKYLRTGVPPEQRQVIYADLSEIPDLREAIHMVNDAQQAFMELPAEVRREFDNDPVKLVEFAQDPRNLDRAVELGLATRRPESPSQPSKAVPGVQPGSRARSASGSSQSAEADPNSTTT